MTEREDNLLDSIDKLPERIALMLAPVLAEALKTSTGNIVDKVNKSSKSSKSNKVLTKKEIETISVASTANVVKSLENVFKQKRMMGSLNDPTVKLGMQQTGYYPRGLTQSQINNQINKSMPTWIKTGFKTMMPAVYSKAMQGGMPISGYMKNVMFQKEFAKFLANPINPVHTGKMLDINKAIGQAKLDKINKQIQMAKYNSLTRFAGESDFIKDKNALTPKGLKSKYWHNMSNMEMLSKGAIPLSYGSSKSKLELDLLGGILNNTKGLLVLDKKQQKEWDKWKKSFSKDIQGMFKSGVSTVATVVTPLLKDVTTMGVYKLLNDYVRGAKTPEERKSRSDQARWGVAIGLPIATALVSNPYIQGRLAELSLRGIGKLGKMGFTKLIGEEALKGGIGTSLKGLGSKIPLLAALSTYGVGAWGAVTGFKRGNKEGGLKEGLLRGAVNIPTSIAKTILQSIPGLGKFASGISDKGIEGTLKNLVKLIQLSSLLGFKMLQNYFDVTFKKIFGSSFDLFKMLKDAFMEAWKHRPAFLGGDGGTSPKGKSSLIDTILSPLTPNKKANLANTMAVIKNFQGKVGGGANISSIMGGKHDALSGHYQGKKFDVGLYGKNDSERIKQYKALVSTSGVASLGFETPDKKKYELFKKELIKQKIDVAKLKPYYWGKNSSGEHFDVTTEMTKNSSQTATPQATKQTTAPTRRISSNDPTQNNLCATVVLNSLTA